MIAHQILDPFRQRAAVEDLIELGARFVLLALADKQAQAMPGQRVVGGRARLDRARGGDRSRDILVAGGEMHQGGDQPRQTTPLAPSAERIRLARGHVLLATRGGQNVDVVNPCAEIRAARAAPLQQQEVAQLEWKCGRQLGSEQRAFQLPRPFLRVGREGEQRGQFRRVGAIVGELRIRCEGVNRPLRIGDELWRLVLDRRVDCAACNEIARGFLPRRGGVAADLGEQLSGPGIVQAIEIGRGDLVSAVGHEPGRRIRQFVRQG